MENQIIELYNKKIKIKFNPVSHSYWLIKKKLERLTGVTTFISILDKSRMLIPWAVGITVGYIIKHEELIKDEEVDSNTVYSKALVESENQKNKAAEIGTAIHEWVDEYIAGNNPEMPTDKNILRGVMNFLEWTDHYGVKFLWSERVVYSKKYNYVGTADIAFKITKGEHKGKKFLADLKTSNGIYPEVKLQTAAYLKAYEEETGEKFNGRWALRISKETENEYRKRNEKKNPKYVKPYKTFEAIFLDENNEIESDFKGFINAVKLFNWKKIAEKEFDLLRK